MQLESKTPHLGKNPQASMELFRQIKFVYRARLIAAHALVYKNLPLNTGRKLNVHKTLNLRAVSKG